MGGTLDDPLAGLSDYDIGSLPYHLAQGGLLPELHRLLELRSHRGSNAWYAAKRSTDQYLADLSIAADGAANAGDLGYALRYALISQGVRSSAALPGPLLGALVRRGRFSLAEGLSLARSASDIKYRIEGLTCLLPHSGGAQRIELINEILSYLKPETFAGRPGDEASSHTGGTAHYASAILAALEAIAAGETDDGIRAQLVAVPYLLPTFYGRILADVIIADCLSPSQRDEILLEAWSLAGRRLSFEGRPEGQAAVAVKFPRGAGGDHVAEALATVIEGIRDTEERLRHSWAPHGGAPLFDRPRLLRIYDFVAPLRELAPALDQAQVRSIPQRLGEQTSYQARFAIAAVLPRLAQLGFAAEAREWATRLRDLRTLALAEITAAEAGPASLTAQAASLLDWRTDDPALQVLTRIAVIALLNARDRPAAVRQILTETRTELPSLGNVRSEVISRLPPLIRSLLRHQRDRLVTEIYARDPALVSSAAEADEILLPLADVLPLEILESQLSAIRSIGVAADTAAAMWRTPAQPTVPSGGPVPAAPLPADLARDALAAARAAKAADRAEMLVFLAPLLGRESRAAARTIAVQIESRLWRPEPLWRLTAAESPAAESPAAVADCLRALFEFSGGFDRVRHLIEEVAAGLEQLPYPAGELREPVDAFLRSGPSLSDLTECMPVILAVGGPPARDRAERTLHDLAAWFGDGGSARPTAQAEKPADERVTPPPFTADPVAGCARLIRVLAEAGNYPAAGVFLTYLRADDRASADEAALAERFIIDRFAAPDQGAPGHAALVESIAATAGTVEVRTSAQAALLRAAVVRQDAAEATRLAARIEDGAAAEPAQEVLALSAIMTDVVDAAILTSDLSLAARLWNRVVGLEVPYQPVVGVRLTQAAAVIAASADATPGKHVAEEAMLRGYFGFAYANQEDYALAEAAGDIVRRRAAAARTAGRAVDEEWFELLDALADADDPDETLLHLSAVEATCDAAVAAMIAGDPQASASYLRRAFVRRRRHPDCVPGVDYFAATALTVGEEAARTGHAERASEAACLAWLAARTASEPGMRTVAERLLRESAGKAQAGAKRLQAAQVLSFAERNALTAWLEALPGGAGAGAGQGHRWWRRAR
jgi:hypothetical protein